MAGIVSSLGLRTSTPELFPLARRFPGRIPLRGTWDSCNASPSRSSQTSRLFRPATRNGAHVSGWALYSWVTANASGILPPPRCYKVILELFIAALLPAAIPCQLRARAAWQSRAARSFPVKLRLSGAADKIRGLQAVRRRTRVEPAAGRQPVRQLHTACLRRLGSGSARFGPRGRR